MNVVLGAGNLHSDTDHAFESWPIEPLAPQLVRAINYSNRPLTFKDAFSHAIFTEKAVPLTSFSSDKIYPMPLLENSTV